MTLNKRVVSPFFLAVKKIDGGVQSTLLFGPFQLCLNYLTGFARGEASTAHYSEVLPGDQRDFLHDTSFIFKRCIAFVREVSNKVLNFRTSSQ